MPIERIGAVSGYNSHKEIDFGAKLALPALLADFRLMNEFANGKLTLKKEGMYYQGLFSHNNPYDGEWYYSSDNTKYSTVTEGKEK